jgi:hypothetical protein
MRRALVIAVAAAGCTSTTSYFLPEPIPLGLDGGALVSTASIDDFTQTFPIVIDTGSPVTAWDNGSGSTSLHTGKLRLDDVNGVPRLELDDVRLYATPLRSLGLSGFPIGGVLGGDNLQRWVLGLDYRDGPVLTVVSDLTPCNCELARDCNAVFPFTLAGGGQDRPLTIGPDVLSYPATRILVDVCLEPYMDPVSSSDPTCVTPTGLAPGYLPSGVDARLIVATGFPGFALAASTFDRLRGPGSADAALAAPVSLHLPDPADDGADMQGLPVGAVTLGRPGAAALVVVERQGYLSPCQELARSRRQRRNPPGAPRTNDAGVTVEADCQVSDACMNGNTTQDACDDNKSQDHVSALIELDALLPTFVMQDTAPILVGVNADVRPGSATVDGIIGTAVLQQLTGSIDYPGHRWVARCTGAGCLTYPAFRNPDAFNHPGEAGSGCQNDNLCQKPVDIPPNGGLCPPAS